jgi:hypothetical protein
VPWALSACVTHAAANSSMPEKMIRVDITSPFTHDLSSGPADPALSNAAQCTPRNQRLVRAFSNRRVAKVSKGESGGIGGHDTYSPGGWPKSPWTEMNRNGVPRVPLLGPGKSQPSPPSFA